jgi:phage baseplate assembly protein W
MDYIYTDLSSTEKSRLDYDADAIKNSLKNILNTRKGEFPGNPHFGSDVSDYLFEMADGVTNSIIQFQVEQAIRNFEKRVKVEAVVVEENVAYNSISLDIYFSIIEDVDDTTHSVTITY